MIPGVTVIVTDSMGIVRSDITDANGLWSISGIFPGPATIEVIVPPGFFLTTPPNPRNVIVPADGGVHIPIQEGIGLTRIDLPEDPISPEDMAPLIAGGIVIAFVLLTCCWCTCCRLPHARRHVHQELLPRPHHHHIYNMGGNVDQGRKRRGRRRREEREVLLPLREVPRGASRGKGHKKRI